MEKPRCLRAVRTRWFPDVWIRSSLDRGIEGCNAASAGSSKPVGRIERQHRIQECPNEIESWLGTLPHRLPNCIYIHTVPYITAVAGAIISVCLLHPEERWQEMITNCVGTYLLCIYANVMLKLYIIVHI